MKEYFKIEIHTEDEKLILELIKMKQSGRIEYISVKTEEEQL